jgi:hypothetical protein
MKCAYHPAAESQELCSTCSKPLCSECSHRVKGKVYCQDCLVQGAELSATAKDLRVPVDSPRRAALCAVIPGIGAVYNGDYMKAITYFAIFAALVVMGDDVHGVFGFGAAVFLIFTMFEAYRTAEANTRARLDGRGGLPKSQEKEQAVVGWGIFLILLGFMLLLRNYLPYEWLMRLWPVAFILLGGYLVYGAVKDGNKRPDSGTIAESPFADKTSDGRGI